MDKQILQAIQQKQEQGVTLLLEQYGGLLNAIVRKYIGGRPQEIEECLADIVVAIWYHIDDFDATKNSFKNWIAVIAKFKAIDALRKIERQQPTVELPEQLATTQNMELDWQAILQQLPQKEQEIFHKYYFEGLAAKEIAQHYQTKASWVHNKLSRSRHKLRTLFLRDEV
ncbi:sigma-70 family RNA polymerase sigma factor [Lysinibacillus sp. FSL K6-0232]|uniref:sigma-70 family RNA polymerase sigma factor n=1 Tax=unclassified Lysinibacillus TaxID=2636778 RepID=UPI0030FAAC90